MAIRILQNSFNQTVQSNQINIKDFEKSSNTLDEYVSDFIDGYITNQMDTGQLKTITESQLETWLASPDQYYKEISTLMTYMYISDGSIYQLYTLIQSLPTLNYKIKVFDTSVKGYEKNLTLCNKILSKVKYKQTTRDLLSQEAVNGYVISMWIGEKKNPYLYIFDNMEYVFPAYRRNGDWVCLVDMTWIDKMKEREREQIFETLSPYITEANYNAFVSNKEENQYVELPQERTTCNRINTLFRNQRLGIPMGTQYLFNYLHKQTLKNLEKSIATKIIKNIAILTIGNENKPYESVNKALKKKIITSVRNSLKKSVETDSVPVAILPEFATLGWSKLDGFDGLEKDKFESVNYDINNDLGVSSALTSGTGANFASAKLNLDMLYKRIGLMLEGLEDVYNKLLALVLPRGVYDNFCFEFEKDVPLTKKEQMDILMKLHAEGYSVKAVIDLLPDVYFDEYITNSIYEIETLKLREKIIPPSTSYTLSGEEDDIGRDENDDATNENTINSKENDKNNQPKTSD